MKFKRIAAYFCAAALLTLTGCGNTEADTVAFDDAEQNVSANAADLQQTSKPAENDDADNANSAGTADAQQTDSGQENANTNNENADSSQPAQAQEDGKEDTEWEGVVESIGDNSIVAAEIAIENSEEAVYAFDSGKKVTVHFSADTTYEVKTVKNGGVNGDADTDIQQGSFSDIKEQSTVNLTGSYQGDEFYATHVVIYRFV